MQIRLWKQHHIIWYDDNAQIVGDYVHIINESCVCVCLHETKMIVVIHHYWSGVKLVQLKVMQCVCVVELWLNCKLKNLPNENAIRGGIAGTVAATTDSI